MERTAAQWRTIAEILRTDHPEAAAAIRRAVRGIPDAERVSIPLPPKERAAASRIRA